MSILTLTPISRWTYAVSLARRPCSSTLLQSRIPLMSWPSRVGSDSSRTSGRPLSGGGRSRRRCFTDICALTLDLDLVLQLDRSNLERALRAFGDLGFRPQAPVPLSSFADVRIARPVLREEHDGLLTLAAGSSGIRRRPVLVQAAVRLRCRISSCPGECRSREWRLQSCRATTFWNESVPLDGHALEYIAFQLPGRSMSETFGPGADGPRGRRLGFCRNPPPSHPARTETDPRRASPLAGRNG